jgi:hypothetical protein
MDFITRKTALLTLDAGRGLWSLVSDQFVSNQLVSNQQGRRGLRPVFADDQRF